MTDRELIGELLHTCKEAHLLLENLWKAVPWKNTFDLDIARLNQVALMLPAIIARTETHLGVKPDGNEQRH